MKLRETVAVSTNTNFFSSVEELESFIDQMRAQTGHKSSLVNKEKLVEQGIIVSQAYTLGQDGYRYMRVRVWRSPEDYEQHFDNSQSFNEGVGGIGWQILTAELAEIPD